jgi:hypothetical protein
MVQATDNTAHAHCMLDNQGYRHSQNMQYVLLSTVTIVTRTRLNVTLISTCCK